MSTSTLAAVAAAAAGPGDAGGNREPTPAPLADRQDANGAAGMTAALDEATARGRAEGAAAERQRFSAIVAAEGIATNPGRLAAAIELAASAPDMTAEAVAAMVTKHVPEAKAGLSLADRAADADPLGTNSLDAGDRGSAAGINIGAVYAKHNAR